MAPNKPKSASENSPANSSPNSPLNSSQKNPPTELIEGEDFYFNEEGLMVLTAIYLKKRGYCCESGCKHCPYGAI